MRNFTLDDLGRIMRECAGEAEDTSWGQHVLETPFDELGYDSIAILEATARIQREFGIRVADDSIPNLVTPQVLIEHVNQLPAAAHPSA